MLKEANIDVQGIFLNADAAFDTTLVRSLCVELGIEANIPINSRHSETMERYEYFDAELYKKRTAIERTFARLDSFKALLVRYEKNLAHWNAWNLIGFIVIFISKILNNRKS